MISRKVLCVKLRLPQPFGTQSTALVGSTDVLLVNLVLQTWSETFFWWRSAQLKILNVLHDILLIFVVNQNFIHGDNNAIFDKLIYSHLTESCVTQANEPGPLSDSDQPQSKTSKRVWEWLKWTSDWTNQRILFSAQANSAVRSKWLNERCKWISEPKSEWPSPYFRF